MSFLRRYSPPPRWRAPRRTITRRWRNGCTSGCLSAEAATATSAEIEAAKEECPDQTPTLRIETGTHTNTIQSIAVDAACTVAVTGSMDKTARLWSLPEGRLLRTFRPPIGEGDGGDINAVALSPDGRWVALGGYDAHQKVDGSGGVYVFARDGGIVRRIGAFEGVVDSLASSPDGRRLAAGLGGDAGVSVLDFATGNEITRLSGYRKEVNGLAWARDNSLYSASSDGKVRAYGPDLNPTPRKTLNTNGDPLNLAISPDQRRLAIGFGEKARVDLVPLPDLTPAGAADVADAGTGGDFANVAWVDDETLQGAERAHDAEGRYLVRVWNRDGRRQGDDRPVSADNVVDLKPCGGGTAFAAGDPRFGLLDRSGAVQMAVDGAAIQNAMEVARQPQRFPRRPTGSLRPRPSGQDAGRLRPRLVQPSVGPNRPDRIPEGAHERPADHRLV